MYEILKNIKDPDDVKKLNMEQLKVLATEIREGLFNRITKVGGHFGPNFGVVELEIAMHYVFNSPTDKFIFDVSHQTYPHKMLTGRSDSYIYENRFSFGSGYSNPNESPHDMFTIGHTSTSVSLATGMAKARDQRGESHNVIALIGDGSLSGGEALEALNVAGSEINSNLIILINDNQQSISETHGGLYKSLRDLRQSNGTSANNIFKAFGLDYIYENNGNDIESLIKVFEKVKDVDHPIVVHINTIKGKGYKLAEECRENWHYVAPFDRETGNKRFSDSGETYRSIAHDFIMKKAKEDESFVVVTPNMPSSMALSIEDRRALGDKYIDVGIAEEQAVAMASGLAKGGLNPLVVTNTTFMQRAYDQISHDVCINDSPVTILLNYSSFASLTDITHLGIFGISLFSNIPNLVVLAPTAKDELLSMLEWANSQRENPVLILLPGNEVDTRSVKGDFESLNKFVVEKEGEKVAILGLGDFFQLADSVCKKIEETLNFSPTLINPRFASGVDEELLNNLCQTHQLIITLEDGILDGGFGSKVASFCGCQDVKVKNYGLKKDFYDRYVPETLLEESGITVDKIVEFVKNNIN